jgi:hypothetical protein
MGSKTIAEVILVSKGGEKKSLSDSLSGDKASPAIVPINPTTIVPIAPRTAKMVWVFERVVGIRLQRN